MRAASLGRFLAIAGLGLAGVAGPAAAPPSSPQPAPAPAPGGLEVLRGQVTAIDAGRGTLRLRTDTGEVELPLPPGGLGPVRVGDWLTVEIELHPSVAPGRGGDASPGPPARIQ